MKNRRILSLVLALAMVFALATANVSAAASEGGAELTRHDGQLYRYGEEAEDVVFWTTENAPCVQYVDPSLVAVLYPDDGWTYDGSTLRTASGSFYTFDTETNTVTYLPLPPVNLIWEGHIPIIHSAGSEDGLREVTIDLSRDNFSLVSDGEKVLVPLPVLSVLFAEVRYDNLFSDGKDIYFAYINSDGGLFSEESFTDRLIAEHEESLAETWGRLYTAEDEALLQANYDGLCLRFDYGYGLPAPWEDEGFDAYLSENYPEIRELLFSGNGIEYELGLYFMASIAISDGGHTSLASEPYYLATLDEETKTELQERLTDIVSGDLYAYDTSESRSMNMTLNYYRYSQLRSEALGDDTDLTLRYFDDMAVISFDEFEDNASLWKDWEAGPIPEDDGVIGFFYDCFQDIETHPEVKKVVIDLTVNGGGLADVVLAIMGFIQRGESTATLVSNATGSVHTEKYTVDTNLDGVTDALDSFDGQYDFYILTSEFSFSCANFLPALAKEQGAASIIGHRSGGGSCPVVGMRDLFGSSIFYSGDWSLYTRSGEGELESADGGVETDLWLPDGVFYDDAALSNAIDGYNRGIVRSFEDVPLGMWYSDAVQWAYGEGVTLGMEKNLFGVSEKCTEGQMVTFLGRIMGESEEDVFTWADENGLIDENFDGNDPLSREEAVTYLYRFESAFIGEAAAAASQTFADVAPDAPYADAVSWAVETGVTNGTGGNLFSPDMTVSRDQAVTLLYRYFTETPA